MFENEKLYLAAVENYRRESTAAAAIRIYDTFFEQHAPKKIEIAAFDRSNVFEHIVQYRHTEKQREAMGFFQRMTSPGTKVDSKVFDAVTRAVKLKFRVSTAQYSMLEMIRLKNHHRMVLDQVKAQTKAGSHGLSAEAVAQHLRESALTINFCSTGFFADQPEVGSKYLNIWERNTNDDRPEGYAAKRGAAEKATFGFQGGELPSDRPRYAALNYGRLRTGAAMHYGWSYFILKQDVKDRATFTHDDTFYISKYIVTDASLQELRGKIPDPALQRLRAVKDPQRKYTVHEFETLLKSFGLQDSDILTIKAATQKEGTDAKKVVTYERLERIVRWLDDSQLKAVAEICRDPSTIDARYGGYIEAQIHGPIDFAEDIEEICIELSELETADDEAKVRGNIVNFANKYGLRVTYYNFC